MISPRVLFFNGNEILRKTRAQLSVFKKSRTQNDDIKKIAIKLFMSYCKQCTELSKVFERDIHLPFPDQALKNKNLQKSYSHTWENALATLEEQTSVLEASEVMSRWDLINGQLLPKISGVTAQIEKQVIALRAIGYDRILQDEIIDLAFSEFISLYIGQANQKNFLPIVLILSIYEDGRIVFYPKKNEIEYLGDSTIEKAVKNEEYDYDYDQNALIFTEFPVVKNRNSDMIQNSILTWSRKLGFSYTRCFENKPYGLNITVFALTNFESLSFSNPFDFFEIIYSYIEVYVGNHFRLFDNKNLAVDSYKLSKLELDLSPEGHFGLWCTTQKNDGLMLDREFQLLLFLEDAYKKFEDYLTELVPSMKKIGFTEVYFAQIAILIFASYKLERIFKESEFVTEEFICDTMIPPELDIEVKSLKAYIDEHNVHEINDLLSHCTQVFRQTS